MKLLALAALAIVTAVSPGVQTRSTKPASPDRSSLTLLYSAGARGQIRSCNCTKFRFGGYGREMTLVNSVRAKSPNTILIEGGDVVDWTGFQAELKTEVASKAFDLMDYQAMVPGEAELGRITAKYMDHFTSKSIPIILANYCPGGDKPAYQPYLITKTNSGLRVGIIGLLSQSGARFMEDPKFSSALKDPVEVLSPLIGKVRAKSDLVVVIYHGSTEEAGKLARFKGVDIIMATHRSDRNIMFPDKTTNEVSVPIKSLGKPLIISAETNANWSLGRVDLQLTRDLRIKGAKHSLFYLDRTYDEDPKMVAVYDHYNDLVKEAVLNNSAKFKQAAEAMLSKRGLDLVAMRQRLHKSPYVTAEKCKECHADQYEAWSKSRHAHAMATLERSKQDFDPECVSCHTTGANVRNGFANNKDTPQLANVQCESCHSGGADHIKWPAKGFGKAGEVVCRSCHTEERCPDFDYETAWAKIKH